MQSHLVQREGNRMTEHLPQQPETQMPRILALHPLGLETVRQLAKYGVDTVAQSDQKGTPPIDQGGLGSRFAEPNGASRVTPSGTTPRPSTSLGAYGELEDDPQFVDIGGSQAETGNQSRPAQVDANPEAKKV